MEDDKTPGLRGWVGGWVGGGRGREARRDGEQFCFSAFMIFYLSEHFQKRDRGDKCFIVLL